MTSSRADGRGGNRDNKKYTGTRLQLAKRRTEKIYDVKCPNVRGKNIILKQIIKT